MSHVRHLSCGSEAHFEWHFFLINMYAPVHILLVFLHVQILLLFSPDNLCQRTVSSDAYMRQGNPNGVHGYTCNRYLYLQMMGSFSHIRLHHSYIPCFCLIIWLVSILAQLYHNYSEVTMSAMASQFTGISMVYATVCSCADQRKHQSSASLAFMRGIHRSPVISPHKGPVTRKTFTYVCIPNNKIYREHTACTVQPPCFAMFKAARYNTLMQRQHCRHFANVEFIFMNGNSSILI